MRPVEAAARRKASADSATRPAWAARVPISNQTWAASRSAPTPVSVAMARRYQSCAILAVAGAPGDLAEQDQRVDADEREVVAASSSDGRGACSRAASTSPSMSSACALHEAVASPVGGAGLAPVELEVGEPELLLGVLEPGRVGCGA